MSLFVLSYIKTQYLPLCLYCLRKYTIISTTAQGSVKAIKIGYCLLKVWMLRYEPTPLHGQFIVFKQSSNLFWNNALFVNPSIVVFVILIIFAFTTSPTATNCLVFSSGYTSPETGQRIDYKIKLISGSGSRLNKDQIMNISDFGKLFRSGIVQNLKFFWIEQIFI